MIKFNKFHVTDGTVKVRVRYCASKHNGVDCVALYAQDFGYDLDRLLVDLESRNNTDSQTDYFDKTTAWIPVNHPLYQQALARCRQGEIK